MYCFSLSGYLIILHLLEMKLMKSVFMNQAVDLLRASLLTSCALSSALGDFIAKKPRKEPLCQTQLRRSQRKKQKVDDCQAS